MGWWCDLSLSLFSSIVNHNYCFDANILITSSLIPFFLQLLPQGDINGAVAYLSS